MSRRCLRARLPASAAACLAALTAPPGHAQLTAAESDALLAQHNAVRAATAPAAADMRRLVWDPALATVAQQWADRCAWQHNPARDAAYARIAPDGGDVGENLYISTATRVGTLAGAVGAWAVEAADYTHASNACAPGRACGHYTQIVWAGTHRVGCGVRHCPAVAGLHGFAHAHLLVCDYAPAGNIVGRRPYVAAEPGSRCPPDRPVPADRLCSSPPEPLP